MQADAVTAGAKSVYLRGRDAVAKGRSITLSVPSTQTGTWAWKSSDPAIATVSSNGVVKGVSHGEVVITASKGSTTLSRTIAVYQTSIKRSNTVAVGKKITPTVNVNPVAMREWS